MDNRLLTQLEILKLSGEKPNFSKLGREYGIDRRTVKRYYDGYAGKPATRNKPSKLDQHEAIIRQKMAIRGATIKAVYEFLYGKYGESIGTYSNFRKYVTSRGITPNKKVRGHPRFETAPGLQAQVDWKEDLQIANCLAVPWLCELYLEPEVLCKLLGFTDDPSAAIDDVHDRSHVVE
jgi:transposase